MSTIGRAAVEAAIELGSAITRLVIDALQADDIQTIRKVSDVLPDGHPLRARLALIAGEEKARRELDKVP